MERIIRGNREQCKRGEERAEKGERRREKGERRMEDGGWRMEKKQKNSFLYLDVFLTS